jgi:hypothetical protein
VFLEAASGAVAPRLSAHAALPSGGPSCEPALSPQPGVAFAAPRSLLAAAGRSPPLLSRPLLTCALRLRPPRAEGVLYAEKDFNLAEHPEIKEVPNLQVIKLMQSFKSREFVTERFAWRHYYW